MRCTYATVMRSIFTVTVESFHGGLWIQMGFALIYAQIITLCAHQTTW